tara:strand:+ start:4375 stop:5865 length:1491 start_codon:yes stop_codon:yes gene_type:complete
MTNPILLDNSFFDEINKYRENTNRSKLKLNSMKQYINNYNIVSKMVDAKVDDKVHFLSNPDLVFEAMKRDNWKTHKPPSNSTTRNYLNSLIIVGEIWNIDKSIQNQYTSLRDSKNQIYNEAQAEAKLDDTDIYIKKEEVDAMLKTIDTQLKGEDVYKQGKSGWDTLTNENKDKYTFMIMMYVYIKHPVRNDFGNMGMLTKKKHSMLTDSEKEGKNYLLKNDKSYQFAFADYKTNKDDETVYVDIVDRELIKHLKKYIAIIGFNSGMPLFTQKNQPFTKNAITKFLQKWNTHYLKKPASTRAIRKSFYTEKYGGDQKVDLNELKTDAKNNLHGVGTAINIYTNAPPEPEPQTDNLQKRLEYYEFTNDVYDRLLKIVDDTPLERFEKLYSHNILPVEEFLYNIITKNKDIAGEYTKRRKQHEKFMGSIKKDNTLPKTAEFEEYVNEDIYLDDLKSFGGFISGILFYYGERIGKWDAPLMTDMAIDFVSKDMRFSQISQ